MEKPLRPLKGILLDLLDFVYPPHCELCAARLDRGERIICRTCWRDVNGITAPFCSRCGIPLSTSDTFCDACLKRGRLFSFSRSYGLFDLTLRHIVHLLKYRRRKGLAAPLVSRMAVLMGSDARYGSMDALIPVPLHGVKRRSRGFNQSRLLAGGLSLLSGLPVIENVLIRKRNTVSQSSLSLSQRMTNVRGAFAVTGSPAIRDRRVILIDDVLTTGSTADACAGALLQAGAAEVCVMTVARAAGPETV
jgi:ComF family protein